MCYRSRLLINKFNARGTGHQLERRFSKLVEINAMYKPLRRSRSFKATVFGTNRKLISDFLLVINSNLPPILHRFLDIALERSKIAVGLFGYPSSA